MPKGSSGVLKEPTLKSSFSKTHYIANNQVVESDDGSESSDPIYTLFSLTDHLSELYQVQVDIKIPGIYVDSE